MIINDDEILNIVEKKLNQVTMIVIIYDDEILNIVGKELQVAECSSKKCAFSLKQFVNTFKLDRPLSLFFTRL